MYTSTSTPKIKPYQSLLQNSLQHQPIQQTIFTEITPSTPQKFNMLKNLKVLNVSSQTTENSFRTTNNTKRILTQDSPQLNKENANIKFDQHSTQIEIQLKRSIQENLKLSNLVTKLTKEKQQLIAQIQHTDFHIIKQRVERLESVIDHQADEIEDWKKKYMDACQNDPNSSIIENMEIKITQTLKENERLNQIHLNQLKKIENLEQIIKDLEYKVTDQNNQIIVYEEERINFQDKRINQLEQPSYTINFNYLEYITLIENKITDLTKFEHDNQKQYENIKEEFNTLQNKLNYINFKKSNIEQITNILNEFKNNITNQRNP
ncbi:unnamed protein product [Paramecium sonneborni]|uniref:Uncharacterized protein n=1 Tax=Paramecium sonneborni TaxID=65129 RepID=A0A8S1RAY1_9CILI|nr:unnamed protein product [Paramecium sonneborni]CAD8125048.1 unnamed protein product [Paramecium sonneborni]